MHDFLQRPHADIYTQEDKAFHSAIIPSLYSTVLMLTNSCEPEENMFAMEYKLESLHLYSVPTDSSTAQALS
jgi:hypothetical protein